MLEHESEELHLESEFRFVLECADGALLAVQPDCHRSADLIKPRGVAVPESMEAILREAILRDA